MEFTTNRSGNNQQQHPFSFQYYAYFHLKPETGSSSCSIACLHPLADGRLAVSTDTSTSVVSSTTSSVPPNQIISVPISRAVFVLNFTESGGSPRVIANVDAILNGHPQDAVQCLLGLPNGDLVTGGGKMDATLQVWNASQLKQRHDDSVTQQQRQEGANDNVNDGTTTETAIMSSVVTLSHKTLKDEKIGYVFALALLSDHKKDSNHFAIAAARYNQVKIIL